MLTSCESPLGYDSSKGYVYSMVLRIDGIDVEDISILFLRELCITLTIHFIKPLRFFTSKIFPVAQRCLSSSIKEKARGVFMATIRMVNRGQLYLSKRDDSLHECHT